MLHLSCQATYCLTYPHHSQTRWLQHKQQPQQAAVYRSSIGICLPPLYCRVLSRVEGPLWSVTTGGSLQYAIMLMAFPDHGGILQDAGQRVALGYSRLHTKLIADNEMAQTMRAPCCSYTRRYCCDVSGLVTQPLTSPLSKTSRQAEMSPGLTAVDLAILRQSNSGLMWQGTACGCSGGQVLHCSEAMCSSAADIKHY